MNCQFIVARIRVKGDADKERRYKETNKGFERKAKEKFGETETVRETETKGNSNKENSKVKK